jgi:hypothetical protein
MVNTSIAMTTGATARSFKISYGVLAFFLVVANLRPALTGVGPLLESIQSGLGLSGTAAGLLPALPLLIFAGFSPLARLGNVFGIERTLAGCLALVVVGIALRSQGSITALFGGTVIFAIGIGIANVLVPSVIKRDFPDQVGGMTTAYVMVMTLAGAVATGLAVPLAAHLAGGWRASLAVWAAFAALAWLCWLPQAQKANVSVPARRWGDKAAAKADLAFGHGLAGYNVHGPPVSHLLRHDQLGTSVPGCSWAVCGRGGLAVDALPSDVIWHRPRCALAAGARTRPARACGDCLPRYGVCYPWALGATALCRLLAVCLRRVLRTYLHPGFRAHRYAHGRSSTCGVSFNNVSGGRLSDSSNRTGRFWLAARSRHRMDGPNA